MQFDYDQLAKKFFEQLNGNLKTITLVEYTTEYQSFVERNRALKTCEGVKLVSKHLLEYYPPIKEINSIELKDAEKFIDSLKKKAPLGVYNYLRTLRAMFNKAIEWNYLRNNVFVKVKLPKRQEKNPEYLTVDELTKILEKIDKQFVKDIAEISFYTGLRLGEATFLKWKNISLNTNIITIGDDSFTTKSRKSRSIPVHPRVKEIIERLKDGSKNKKDDYLFRKTRNQPFTGSYISKKFKKGCRAAGIDEAIHYHTLRHSTGSLLAQKGVSLYTIQKILGHSSPTVSQIYAHMQIDTLREAINQIN